MKRKNKFKISLRWLFFITLTVGMVIVVSRQGEKRQQAAAFTPVSANSEVDLNSALPSRAFEEDYVPGEVLVAFRRNVPRGKADEIRAAVGASVIKELREIGVQRLRLAPGLEVSRAIQILSAKPEVRFVEPNYIVTIDQLPDSPNDAYRSDLWGMHNLGQSNGTNGVDINAPEAWAVSTGSPNVVVGVIDSGIDYNHPDLQNNIWSNPGETGTDAGGRNKATNGVDDDGNGYIDDVRGWDFANQDNNPLDDNGHGTHVAGTIGGEGNNSNGVVGVNWRVRLMPLKFLAANGSGNVADATSAILYAASFKDASGVNLVRITNNSWGGGKRSSTLQNAIASSGALFVAAAGNSGSSQTAYPAGYPNDNVISVAATDHNDSLASFSNFSSNWVDLGAPGVNIVSTYRDNQYRSLNGTSMASPHVAGVAALILADSPTLTNAVVKARIMNSVDPVPSLAGKTVTGGRLNAGRALGSTTVLPDNCQTAPCAPADVTNLSVNAAAATPVSVTLAFTATGDDGASGTAYLYDVRYSTSPINTGNFAQATVAGQEPSPKIAGSAESFAVTGLRPGTTYYFAMRTADEVGNYSAIATTNGTTAASPWQVSVVIDNANDLGFYKSLAYDKSANPVPAFGYSDYTTDDVKFARWNGAGWTTQTVDAGTGVYTGISLAYSPLNNPSLSYGWGKLFFTQFVPATQSWQITTLESRNASNDVTSLVYAPNGDPSISYRLTTTRSGELKFARRTATGWTLQTVAAAGARYSSLAYDANGNPSIAFSDDADADNTLDTLRFARWDGSRWNIQVVETGTAGFGVLASLAYGSDGNPAVVHVSGGVVRFVRWNGSSWSPAEVAANGTNASLIFNSTDGNFYVSYSDSNGLYLAKRDAIGWTTEPIDIGMRIRWAASLTISPCGTPSLGYSTSPNNDLRFTSSCPLP